jgi:hypothetical protein
MKPKPFSLRRLSTNLERSGRPVHRMNLRSGNLVVLPQGGRVIGLYPKGSEESFFWTHDALRSPERIRGLYAEARWPNPGGDRTWLSPTTELFVSDLNRFWETWREPVSVDPGHYSCREIKGGLQLAQRPRIELRRRHQTIESAMEKTLLPAADPFRYEAEAVGGYAFAGYTTRSTLTLLREPRNSRVPIGLWQILQLPPDGEMILPTHTRTRPRVIFGKIPRGDVRCEPRCVRYRMRSATTAKIAVRSIHLTGRMGYVRKNGEGGWDLVVRNFQVNPSGEYVDTPFDDPRARGDAVQACKVSEKDLGSFAEIEHHSPAIGAETGLKSCTDISQVWAFRGSSKIIARVSQALLGAKPAIL